MECHGGRTREVIWRGDGPPVSARFDDSYFTRGDALAEARHVYLAGNDLPDRFRPGFQVAELGFGTGLNALTAALDWRRAGMEGALRFTSFEAYPMAATDMARALGPWAEIAPLAGELIAAWAAGERRISLPGLDLLVIEGDARETLPRWEGLADAWFLDGFSPARNPELWEPGLMTAVAAHTAPEGSCATYSAAGAVRASLEASGFAIRRVPGYGAKKHMTRGLRVTS